MFVYNSFMIRIKIAELENTEVIVLAVAYKMKHINTQAYNNSSWNITH